MKTLAGKKKVNNWLILILFLTFSFSCTNATAGLIYSTYVGGSDADDGCDIAVDAAGNVYITGDTWSIDFPTTIGAFDTTYDGSSADVFVSKINEYGNNLIYSTYLGGSNSESSRCIAVDTAGNVYISGWTFSSDFPTTDAAFDTSFNGVFDIFVSKLNADGNSLLYSTYLGGSDEDDAFDIVLDLGNNVFITGYTLSTDFPVTEGALDTSFNGGRDAFVSKLHHSGTTLVYSTYLGGGYDEAGFGIAIDHYLNVYITGPTSSVDFPTTDGALDIKWNGGSDVFVSKINPTGKILLYSTFLGGSSSEAGYDIAVDSTGKAYITGDTYSSDFPTTFGAFDTTYNDSCDAFVSKLNADGSALLYSTFLGGSNSDYGESIAVDNVGNAYIAGSTESSDFPTTLGAFDTSYNGGSLDAFISKINKEGTGLLYSTFLGGSSSDGNFGIAIDAYRNVYVSGGTRSSNFPTTKGAFDTTYNGEVDVFVTKLSSFSLLSAAQLGLIILNDVDIDLEFTSLATTGIAHIKAVMYPGSFPMGTNPIDSTVDCNIGSIKVIKRYYEIENPEGSISNMTANLTLYYSEDELAGISENELGALKSTDGGTSWIALESSVDVDANKVTVLNIDSLSLWTLGQTNGVNVELSYLEALAGKKE